jgi:hypothetical protein
MCNGFSSRGILALPLDKFQCNHMQSHLTRPSSLTQIPQVQVSAMQRDRLSLPANFHYCSKTISILGNYQIVRLIINSSTTRTNTNKDSHFSNLIGEFQSDWICLNRLYHHDSSPAFTPQDLNIIRIMFIVW